MKATPILALCALAHTSLHQAEQPAAWWSFSGEGDSFFQRIGFDSAGNRRDEAKGSFGRADEVIGNAVILDGFTTRIVFWRGKNTSFMIQAPQASDGQG